jgi:hypothetical protein
MNMSELNVDVKLLGGKARLRLEVDAYSNGRIAVTAVDRVTGDRLGRVTVNIPEAQQADGEIFVKTWSENSGWVYQLPELLPHVFRNTGRKVPAGYIQAEVWEFTPMES